MILLDAGLGAADLKEAKCSIDAGQYREAIDTLNVMLKEASPPEISLIKENMAIAYLKDQEQEKAFRLFLEALEEVPKKNPPGVTEEERILYSKALHIYLKPQQSPREIAQQILQEFAPILSEHPDFYQLGFLISAAYANLGQYERFFEFFYPAYQFYPNHFLAYKAKAILHIKLFEREHAGEEKELQRMQILANLTKSIQANPEDPSLYKMKLAFSLEKDKAAVLADDLNKILNNNMIIPRADVIYYVQQLSELKQNALAERLVNRAKEWYPHSRTIEAAQNFVNQNKTQK